MCLELITGLFDANKDHGFVSSDGSIQICQGSAGVTCTKISVQIALNLYHVILWWLYVLKLYV
jgi:hypothetical protein